MDGISETAGQELFLEINRQKPGTQINRLVTCYALSPNPIAIGSLIFHSVHGTMRFMNILFLQRR